MKPHLTYCVNVHHGYTRTEENIESHKEFCDNLKDTFRINFVVNSTTEYGNWGGHIGLLDRYLETKPKLPKNGYLVSLEDDIIIKDNKCLNDAIKLLRVLSYKRIGRNVSHIGHLTNLDTMSPGDIVRIDEPSIKGDLCYKTGPAADPYSEISLNSAGIPFGCQWTDGGFYIFKNEKLLEIKKKLGVLPGDVFKHSPQLRTLIDRPLPEDASTREHNPLDFEDQATRIKYHEVGWCTRLRYHGYEVWGLPDEFIIDRDRLNQSTHKNHGRTSNSR